MENNRQVSRIIWYQQSTISQQNLSTNNQLFTIRYLSATCNHLIQINPQSAAQPCQIDGSKVMRFDQLVFCLYGLQFPLTFSALSVSAAYPVCGIFKLVSTCTQLQASHHNLSATRCNW